ncbi:MAG: ATP-dependent RNA helicase HrpA [Planctomycetota bacterium]
MSNKPTSPRIDLPATTPAEPAELTAPSAGMAASDGATKNGASRRRQARQEAPVQLEYPDELPISAHRDEIVTLIRERQVLVVCGETGSGKSTQLPKFCLEAGLGREAMIGHTQPRRLAARSIAARLAEELSVPLGAQVGYQVRFGDKTSDQTLVKLMTDGILLAETQSDRFLDAYDAIIIDEAHERSLNIDFLLGFLRRLQGKRPDLKIIITSATIDAQRFAEHFSDEAGPAPIINVEGRGYPVQLEYLPWEDVVDDETRGYDLARHVIAGIDEVSRSSDGDTLVFLPTERDIREVSHRVGGHFKRLGITSRVEVLPLYARLPQAEQQKIFHPSGDRRRIIFATNVAESSLTVPGIRSVVDSGTARISRYSPRSKVQRLPIEPVSRASADQRAGRCGRIGPGVCVRLYSEADYENRDRFTTPEIRRTNLASVILQTKTLRLGPIEEFPLLDPPRSESVREGLRTLTELSAIDDRHELTRIGRQLGRMPVDPRVGRILLAASEEDVLAEVLPIAAALELQDPRDRPPDKRQAADEAHAPFRDGRSDFLSYLRLWRYYQDARSEHSRNKLTRVLRQQFLSPTRMREWSDIYRQLREVTLQTLKSSRRGKRGGQSTTPSSPRVGHIRYSNDPDQLVDDDRYAAIHRSLLAGLLSGVAMAGDKNEYTGAGGLKLFLWPGSGIFDAKPKWVVAAELVETTKQYARTVARIQPQWVETVGAHLLKTSHSDPHWSRKSGGAFCYRRQTLFGLPIVAKRRVPLSPIDPATAREILIQDGLAAGELATNAHFVRHNRRLQDAIADLAAKSRRRDLVVDPYTIQRFYQERLPEDVCDRGRLEKFAKSISAPEFARQLTSCDSSDADAIARRLTEGAVSESGSADVYMDVFDLLDLPSVGGDEVSSESFPDELAVGRSELPLTYRFEPGNERDGVNVTIHRDALSQVSDDRLGWLVPGLLEGKLIAMIKSLPKRIRRNLVPAADVARAVADELAPTHGEVPFLPAVCQAFSRHAEMPITEADFQSEKLDDHLQFLVTVVDDEGNTIAEGRQVDPLRQTIAPESGQPMSPTPAMSDQHWSRESMTSFEIESLPSEVIQSRGGVQVAQYPAMVDRGDTVCTALFPEPNAAEAASRLGLMRLFAIAHRKELRRQVRWLPGQDEAKIKLAGAISAKHFESSLMDLLARVSFVDNQPMIRSRQDFEVRSAEGSQRIPGAVQEIAGWLTSLSHQYLRVRGMMESTQSQRFALPRGDARRQLDELFCERFLSVTPWTWLKHFPRYLDGIAYRLDKLQSGSLPRDDEGRQLLEDLRSRWLETLPESQRDIRQQVASEFRWMLEELRINLFAQPLGTSIKISPQRCEKWLRSESAPGR